MSENGGENEERDDGARTERTSSVKELIRQREQLVERQGSQPAPSASLGSRNLSKMFTLGRRGRKRTQRALRLSLPTAPRSSDRNSGEGGVALVEPIPFESLPESSLQKHLPGVVDLQNKRIEAKKAYIAQQIALRTEYEQRLRELHSGFAMEEKELCSQFPEVKNPKLDKAKKLEEEAKKEEDEKASAKMKKEAEILKEEAKRMRPISEIELERLKGMWLLVGVREWDMLNNRAFGGGNFRPDVFEKMRKGDDMDISKSVGTTANGRKIKNGDCANWALSLLRNEEENAKIIPRKRDGMFTSIGRLAVKIAEVDDNKENRERALKVFKEEMKNVQSRGDALRKAVESVCGGQLDAKKMEKLFKEESKLQRSVVLRVTEVDRLTEIVRIVMVLDRNGRPCVGGLPKEDQEQQKNYKGSDRILQREEGSENPIAVPPTEEIVEEAAEDESSSGSEESSEEGEELELEEAESEQEENDEAEEPQEEEHIEGYITAESSNMEARVHNLFLHELLATEGITVVEDDMKAFYKERFNSHVPHITYQRVAGFQVFNNNLNNAGNGNPPTGGRNRRRGNANDDAGDFQLVDLGVKLNFEPLLPLQDYDQDWKNGLLYSVRHKRDGPIRFVGYNETGFGFVEDRPIEMHVQKILDAEGHVKGLNILHMTLFDTNEQICFDTLYLKDDEDMQTNKKWKVFGRDAIGNRLAYRVVGQRGQVQAVLYPFQGRVKEAKLDVKDITHLEEESWVNIVTEGQTSLRLAKIKQIPTGMILGEATEERKSKFPATVFLEMLRARQRVMTEMPGMIDVEIHCEDSQLLPEPRNESWPIECFVPATEDDLKLLKSLQAEKQEEFAQIQSKVMNIVQDVKDFVGDRTKRKNNEVFLQEADVLMAALETQKATGLFSEGTIAEEIEGALGLLKKNIQAIKRATALRRSVKDV